MIERQRTRGISDTEIRSRDIPSINLDILFKPIEDHGVGLKRMYALSALCERETIPSLMRTDIVDDIIATNIRQDFGYHWFLTLV